MYYVYVLQSDVDKTLYIGFTKDLRERLSRHNTGRSRYTKTKMPWRVIYYEAYLSLKDAKEREIKLKKHSQTKELLADQIKNSKNS